MQTLLFLSFFFLSLLPILTLSKSTIEPCSGSSASSCPSLLSYTLSTDLKVSELAALFQTDPYSLLAANSFNSASVNQILPAGLFLSIPTTCACSDGIRKSVSTRYVTRPSDTLTSIAENVYGGLTSAAQIRDANAIDGDNGLDVGQTLVIPLHCTCFNSSDNSMPAVYLSYVVKDGDSVPAIASRYQTTVTDLTNVNSMGSPQVLPGDILSIPLPACASNFPSFTSDYGLTVANGTYAITAGHCVQCSCGPGNLNLYCEPASLGTSCSNMQCNGANLMLGNYSAQPTAGGCSVTACNYGGFVNGTVITVLSTSIQPQCPGPHQFPPLVSIPNSPTHELPPSEAPLAGGILNRPGPSTPGSIAMSPQGGTAGAAPDFVICGFSRVLHVILVWVFVLVV
ncbi:hypothetical protein LUZ60_002760 [Juncus effusus]|nr:hypothetical protein LUZ60_002760 [Juncus effusus]